MDSPPIWERQPGEPLIWYERFTRYRLMGRNRSIDKVYAIERDQKRPKETKKSHPRASGAWHNTAVRFEWTERVEAWDLAEIEAQRIKDEEAFRRELKEHRQNALAVVRQGLAMSLTTAKLVNAQLKSMAKKAEEENFEWLEAESLPNFMRAFASVASASLDCEALVLQVSELLLKIDAEK